MTTLPKPCPKPDCKAPITHWHGSDDDLYACLPALNGRPCPHDDQDTPPCRAPRETPDPLHLPDVDTVARKVYESEHDSRWDDECDSIKDAYRDNARVVLDLIAAHQPVWVEVPKGTLIKAGTRYRLETSYGPNHESTAECDFLSGNGTTFIDPRTLPAPTLTERIRAACNDSPESRITLDVADVEALLDMAGGEDK